MKSRYLICERCHRESKYPTDRTITDGFYLFTQYGWTLNSMLSCPVCNFGPIKGCKLLTQFEEIYKLRKENADEQPTT